MHRSEQKKEGSSVNVFHVLTRMAVFALCAYLLVCLVGNQVDIMVKNKQIDTLEQMVEQKQSENTELRRLQESSDDIGEYYQKVAREKLGYSYPDEKIFVDINGQ